MGSEDQIQEVRSSGSIFTYWVIFLSPSPSLSSHILRICLFLWCWAWTRVQHRPAESSDQTSYLEAVNVFKSHIDDSWVSQSQQHRLLTPELTAWLFLIIQYSWQMLELWEWFCVCVLTVGPNYVLPLAHLCVTVYHRCYMVHHPWVCWECRHLVGRSPHKPHWDHWFVQCLINHLCIKSSQSR